MLFKNSGITKSSEEEEINENKQRRNHKRMKRQGTVEKESGRYDLGSGSTNYSSRSRSRGEKRDSNEGRFAGPVIIEHEGRLRDAGGNRRGRRVQLKGLMRVHNSCRKCGQVHNWIGHGSYRLAILANVVTPYRGAICDEVANAWIDLHCFGRWDASQLCWSGDICIYRLAHASTVARPRCRARLIE